MEQNVLVTKMIGIIVAVIVAAVVLVPICNSLTEGDGGSGGSGGGTVGSIQVPNFMYSSESVFMTDEIGWTAITNTDVESYFTPSDSVIEGELYNAYITGRNGILFQYWTQTGPDMFTTSYQGHIVYDNDTASMQPGWHMTVTGITDGNGTVSSWSLDANGQLTVTYTLSGQSETTNTFKANYLWYDAPVGNYHGMSGYIDGSYTGFYANVGDYIGISGKIGDAPNNWAYTYIGPIEDGMKITVHYKTFVDSSVVDATSTINLLDTDFVYPQEDGRYFFKGTLFAFSPTYNVNGQWVNRTITMDEVRGYIQDDLWSGQIDGDTGSIYIPFGKVGTTIKGDDGDILRPSVAGDFAVVLDNGWGFGYSMALIDECDPNGFELTEDISLGIANVVSFDEESGDISYLSITSQTYHSNIFTGNKYYTYGSGAIATFSADDPSTDWIQIQINDAILSPIWWEGIFTEEDNEYPILEVPNTPITRGIYQERGVGTVYGEGGQGYVYQAGQYGGSSNDMRNNQMLLAGVFPTTLDYRILEVSEGGSSSDGGNDLGVAGTIIGIIPVFVILAILMGAVGLFYQNRKTI